MTTIYISSGDKCRSSDNDVDYHISDHSKRILSRLTEKLVRKYGDPDFIYISPYTQARESLQVILNNLDCDNVEAELDAQLSDKLCSINKACCLTVETRRSGAVICESNELFCARVKTQLQDVRNNDCDVICCITHPRFICKLAQLYNYRKYDPNSIKSVLVISGNDCDKRYVCYYGNNRHKNRRCICYKQCLCRSKCKCRHGCICEFDFGTVYDDYDY